LPPYYAGEGGEKINHENEEKEVKGKGWMAARKKRNRETEEKIKISGNIWR
jgi:hypothetical protein